MQPAIVAAFALCLLGLAVAQPVNPNAPFESGEPIFSQQPAQGVNGQVQGENGDQPWQPVQGESNQNQQSGSPMQPKVQANMPLGPRVVMARPMPSV
uniref:Uncharacterized protein n=1 Tax=Plectus sambesii TaxID=2011161 RepID=A0A914UKU6_9BILA